MKESDRPSIEATIGRIGSSQHGVVARDQLVEAGVPIHAIEYRVKTRRLQPRYRSVYRTGAVGSLREPEMAALLACGPGAAIGHESAAALLGIGPAQAGVVHVTVEGGFRSPGPGVCVHRTSRLDDADVTLVDGIRVTTATRTILDLARVLRIRPLEQMIAEAERLGVVEKSVLAQRARARPDRRGMGALLGLLATDVAFVRSEAEAVFLAMLRRARVRLPETNVRVEGYEVDFLWRAARVVVEIDGYAYHRSQRAFERDHQRDRDLGSAGFLVLRFTWHQLREEPEAVIFRLGRALARAA